eukprot:GHVU01167091.1.p1 GENE.GHVU01167091.1~~GHVU01167091.1.p1  ORF type:complete len:178 (-),score=1.20 GHVU01167091.1:1042-1575(-)
MNWRGKGTTSRDDALREGVSLGSVVVRRVMIRTVHHHAGSRSDHDCSHLVCEKHSSCEALRKLAARDTCGAKARKTDNENGTTAGLRGPSKCTPSHILMECHSCTFSDCVALVRHPTPSRGACQARSFPKTKKHWLSLLLHATLLVLCDSFQAVAPNLRLLSQAGEPRYKPAEKRGR